MRSNDALLILSLMASATTALPDFAEARGFHGAGFRTAHFHGGMRPGWHGGGTQWHAGIRPGWHGGGTRWAGGGYYRGGGYYYGGGWEWPAAAAAGVATGAAIGAATAYGSSCYQTQNVWNGYAYVPQTVRVC